MTENTTTNSGHKKTFEEVLQNFAEQEEAAGNVNRPKGSPAQQVPQQPVQEQPAQPAAEEIKIDEAAHLRTDNRPQGLGFQEIPIEDLPTGGIFYPQGTRIHVRAASGGDIRHWSMMNESEVTQIDDALNYVLERCATISFPNTTASWKDLKEVDRFYLIIAIRDFTFTEGHNELKVAVSETEDVIVKKDNITFIDLPEGLKKYYNPDRRCFTFKTKNTKNPEINIFLPSCGVTQWLKQYVIRKSQAREQFDRDFVSVAPILINDYRKLDDKSYSELIYESHGWGVYEWSLISRVKKKIEDAISPKLKYTDENGAEKETPLNFRGGIKSIFTIDLDEELGI